MRMTRDVARSASLMLVASACTTAGSTWMAQPLTTGDDFGSTPMPEEPMSSAEGAPVQRETRVIGGEDRPKTVMQRSASPGAPAKTAKIEGRVLGSFRNTYYDFPSEADYKGENVALKDPRCKTIRDVPRGFHDAVCVQGSGTLTSGNTVSFAKRDCECAQVCPRTNQQICFDELDARRFPWGRGATGLPITPLLTVAVDTDVIPLNTAVYIPEFDGVPRDVGQTAMHDGCFVAQDRGLRVKGKHVDVFTGEEALTKMWNGLVPSNKGVTVVLDSPRCARATDIAAPSSGRGESSEPAGSKKGETKGDTQKR
jgi:3D (Asp-Asp-Asp) domain-containing protein